MAVHGMEWCQALVRGIDGRSHMINVRAASVGFGARVGDVAAAVRSLPVHHKLPLGALRMATLSHELDLDHPHKVLPRDPASGLLPTCVALVRLRGGKVSAVHSPPENSPLATSFQ